MTNSSLGPRFYTTSKRSMERFSSRLLRCFPSLEM